MLFRVVSEEPFHPSIVFLGGFRGGLDLRGSREVHCDNLIQDLSGMKVPTPLSFERFWNSCVVVFFSLDKEGTKHIYNYIYIIIYKAISLHSGLISLHSGLMFCTFRLLRTGFSHLNGSVGARWRPDFQSRFSGITSLLFHPLTWNIHYVRLSCAAPDLLLQVDVASCGWRLSLVK